MRRREKDKFKDALDFGSGLFGANAAASEAAASDVTREAMDSLRNKATKYLNLSLKQRKGFIFEEIEAAKVNADAARKGIGNRLELTKPGGPADAIEFDKFGKPKTKIQFKSHSKLSDAKKALEDPKYEGQKKTTIADHDGKIEGAKGHTTIADGKASSGGTTGKELKFATKSTRVYAGLQEVKQVMRESVAAGGQAAAAGVVMGGAVSAVRNMHAYSKGHKSGEQVMADITEDSVKSGIRSGSAGWLGSVIRHFGKRMGYKALGRSNVATAVASGVIDVGVTIYEFTKGERTAEETMERLGNTGCSTLSGIYIGAAGGAAFGPPGAVVGSVVGYMLSASVYQSCVAIFRDAKLAERETERVVALCEAAASAMDEQRRQFEDKLAAYMNVRQRTFDKHFQKIDSALFADDHKNAIKGLSGLARSFGKELKLGKFEDFREFMVTSDEPLRL